MNVGVIAGYGALPSLACQNLKAKGYKVVLFKLEDLADDSSDQYADAIHTVSFSQGSQFVELFLSEKIESIALVGKVNKEILFGDFKPDMVGMQVLSKADDYSDDSVMLAIVNFLEKMNIKVLKQTDVLSELLVENGALTKIQLTPEQMSDVKFGYKVAKELGKVDVGQTVVVKSKSVLAVESLEGTDKTIQRGCAFVAGAVVVKTSKPSQDLRFDVPTAGIDTLKVLQASGGHLLALESGATFLIDKEKCVEFANKNNLSIVGVTWEQLQQY